MSGKNYGSVTGGLEAQAELLHKYAYKGNPADGRIIKTFGEIKQIYCPDGAENDPGNLNSQWLGGIANMMNEMGINIANQGTRPQLSMNANAIPSRRQLTAKEELNALNAHMAAVAAGAGKGSGVIASGQLRDGMWVDPKAETLEERRRRVMKRHGLNYKASRESAKEKEAKAKKRQAEKLDAEIEAKQENLRRQQEELEEQQKAQKKAEKENVGEVQIFGRMKKDKNGNQYSADVMMEEIYRALSSNKWTDDATIIEN